MKRLSRFLSVLASLSLLFGGVSSVHAFGVGLQPTTVEIEIEPGARSRQVVNIVNVHKERPISLTLGLADWSLDEDGQIQLMPPGETEASSAEWVRFSPAFVNLEPGEAQQVVVEMMAPSRLERSGDHRFALIASTLLPDERDAGSGVWKKYQLASLFYLTANPASSDPAIVEVTADTEEAPGLFLTFENTGNAHARLNGEVRVLSAAGAVVDTATVSNLVVLDNARRRYRVNLAGLPPEDAQIEVQLENTFAPQAQGEVRDLDLFRAPVGFKASLGD